MREQSPAVLLTPGEDAGRSWSASRPLDFDDPSGPDAETRFSRSVNYECNRRQTLHVPQKNGITRINSTELRMPTVFPTARFANHSIMTDTETEAMDLRQHVIR